jgi:hypothetical protein
MHALGKNQRETLGKYHEEKKEEYMHVVHVIIYVMIERKEESLIF